MAGVSRTALLVLVEEMNLALPEVAGPVDAKVQQLLQWAREAGMPVIRALGSRSEPSPAGDPAARGVERTFSKWGLSAFHDTGLEPWLRSHGADTVIICGQQSHTGCLATALDALTRGFAVQFVSDATLATPLARPGGQMLSHADVQNAVEAIVIANGGSVVTAEGLMRRRPGLRWAQAPDEPAVRRILEESGLPTASLSERLSNFLVADAGEIAGVLEVGSQGKAALLRSVAVATTWRGRGLGEILVEAGVQWARAAGAEVFYLLTSTAEDYFPRFGFRRLERQEVPLDILASLELPGKYPGGGIIMIREVG